MRLVILPILAAFVSASAFAEPVPPSQACTADVARLCPGKELGSEGAFACLRAYQSEASEPCRAHLEERRKALFERIEDTCAAEIANFCTDGRGDEGSARLHCLRSHEGNLSATCRATLPRPIS